MRFLETPVTSLLSTWCKSKATMNISSEIQLMLEMPNSTYFTIFVIYFSVHLATC